MPSSASQDLQLWLPMETLPSNRNQLRDASGKGRVAKLMAPTIAGEFGHANLEPWPSFTSLTVPAENPDMWHHVSASQCSATSGRKCADQVIFHIDGEQASYSRHSYTKLIRGGVGWVQLHGSYAGRARSDPQWTVFLEQSTLGCANAQRAAARA